LNHAGFDILTFRRGVENSVTAGLSVTMWHLCTTLYQPGFKRVGGMYFGFRNRFAAVWRLRTNLVEQARFLL
jgi:hypothetical protein